MKIPPGLQLTLRSPLVFPMLSAFAFTYRLKDILHQTVASWAGCGLVVRTATEVSQATGPVVRILAAGFPYLGRDFPDVIASLRCITVPSVRATHEVPGTRFTPRRGGFPFSRNINAESGSPKPLNFDVGPAAVTSPEVTGVVILSGGTDFACFRASEPPYVGSRLRTGWERSSRYEVGFPCMQLYLP